MPGLGIGSAFCRGLADANSEPRISPLGFLSNAKARRNAEPRYNTDPSLGTKPRHWYIFRVDHHHTLWQYLSHTKVFMFRIDIQHNHAQITHVYDCASEGK